MTSRNFLNNFEAQAKIVDVYTSFIENVYEVEKCNTKYF